MRQRVPAAAPDLFENRLPCFTSGSRDHAPHGTRRSHVHWSESSWSVPVQSRRESAIRCVLTCSGAVNDGVRTSSSYFVIHILTEMTATGGLNKIFTRILERYTRSSPFINSLIWRMLHTICTPSCQAYMKKCKRALEEDQVWYKTNWYLIPFFELIFIIIWFFSWRQTTYTQARKTIEWNHPRNYASTSRWLP